MSRTSLVPVPSHWFLEHYLQYIPLNRTPFTIGRGSDQGLNLALTVISRNHAELIWHVGESVWMLRDFGSTNGSFVNDKPVTGMHKLVVGDWLRFASVEVRLVHMPQANKSNDSKRTDVLGRLPDRTLSIREKIERSIGHNIRQGTCTSQDLADSLNVERSTMYRHIMSEFGISPSELLRVKRLEYAATLLKDKKLAIQVASDAAGFESPAHFSRAFKKHYGVTPSHYQSAPPEAPV